MRRIRSLALLAACVVAGATARAEVIERVEVAAGSQPLAGWLLGVEGEAGSALLDDAGRLVWLPREPLPDFVLRTAAAAKDLAPAAVAALLGDPAEVVRDRAEELLIEQGPLAAPVLGGVLAAEAAETRLRALRVLERVPAPQWRARVRARVDDRDAAVRRAAIHAYAALQPDDLLDVAGGVLRFDDAVGARHAAIVALGRLGDPHAIDPLFDHLEGCEERSLRLVTFDALRRLTGRKLGRDEAAWRAWWTNHRHELLPDEAP